MQRNTIKVKERCQNLKQGAEGGKKINKEEGKKGRLVMNGFVCAALLKNEEGLQAGRRLQIPKGDILELVFQMKRCISAEEAPSEVILVPQREARVKL